MKDIKLNIDGTDYEMIASSADVTTKATYGYCTPAVWVSGNIFIAEKIKEKGKTYIVTEKTIRCLTCNKTSYNDNDIKHLYCGNCKTFHVPNSLNKDIPEVRKDYEILSFLDFYKNVITWYGGLFSSIPEDWIKGCLHFKYQINSVRRLADNLVFKLGDVTNLGVITAFHITWVGMEVHFGNEGARLSDLKFIKPLPKDWEIVSFNKVGNILSAGIRAKHYYGASEMASLQNLLEDVKHGVAAIHEVKRLSDGEVFTVGGRFLVNADRMFTIVRFEIEDGCLEVWTKLSGWFNLIFIYPAPKDDPPPKKDSDGEIISYLTETGLTYKKRANGLFYINNEIGGHSETYLLESYKKIQPYSVKRLKDNLIFAINDTTDCGIIEKFFISEVCGWMDVHFTNGRGATLNSIQPLPKPKVPLFTTEDGVEIFGFDSYVWIIDEKLQKTFTQVGKYLEAGFVKYFSNKQKAEEYIELHKPKAPLKKPLYYTVKGETIYEDDVYYFMYNGVWPEYPFGPDWCHATYGVNKGDIKFKTKEDLYEYIQLNKPVEATYKELREYCDNAHPSLTYHRRVELFFKSKINP